MLHPRPSDVRIRFKPIPEAVEGGCHARVWLPKGLTAGSKPAVALMFHGGAFCFGEDHNVPPAEVNYLNEKGVVVVSAQYRLSPHVKFPEIIDDLLDAYAWVLKDLSGVIKCAGVGKVAVMGWSAGATSTVFIPLHCASKGLPPPSALMVTYGLFDFEAIPRIGAKWEDGLSEEDVERLNKAHERELWTGVSHDATFKEEDLVRREWCTRLFTTGWLLPYLSLGDLKTYDPLPQLTASFPPTAIVGATADELIDIAQTYTFHRKLQDLGVDCQLKLAQGMPHGMAENIPETEEVAVRYNGWWEEAIRPSLDYVLERIS